MTTLTEPAIQAPINWNGFDGCQRRVGHLYPLLKRRWSVAAAQESGNAFMHDFKKALSNVIVRAHQGGQLCQIAGKHVYVLRVDGLQGCADSNALRHIAGFDEAQNLVKGDGLVVVVL